MRLFIFSILFFFISSCATKNIEKSQDEYCFSFKTFPKYHRCTEEIVKKSFKYKYGFEKDIIDKYFAYGEVLAIDVEKGRKKNIDAYKEWGMELQKAVVESEKKGKEAIRATVITAIIAVAVYAIYKEYLEDNYRIEEANQARDNVRSLQKSASSSFGNPLADRTRCNFGRAIFSRGGGYSPFLSSC